MAKKTAQQLVDQANREVRVLDAARAMVLRADQTVFVDIRDVRELARTGRIAGAVHAPRGMLEFWFDEQSPYYRETFNQPGKTFVLYCAAGGRSALAAKALQDMGFDNIAHVDGGFAALKDAGMAIEPPKDG